MLSRRRALISAASESGGKLPSEYQEVEYIESTRTQYIDTNYVIKSFPRVEARIMLTTQSDLDIIGTAAAAEGCFVINYAVGGVRIYYRYGTSSAIYTNNLPSIYNIWINGIWGEKIYYDGVLQLTVTTAGNFANNTQKLFIGRGRSYGEAKYGIIKIYDGNILVRDFIPCYRKSDNEIGMYDLVNGVFYTNAGTGTFLKGADV